METSGLELVGDVDRACAPHDSREDAEQANAVLLFPPDAKLPEGWQTPWVRAGWAVKTCHESDDVASVLAGAGASALIAAPWLRARLSASSVAVARAMQGVIDSLGTAPVSRHMPTAHAGGMVRRGAFLAHLSTVMSAPDEGCCALMAIRVDQAAALTSRLDRAAIFDLEERICTRFGALLRASDPITIWLEFGFGVLIQRDTPDQVRELAERLCASVANEAFPVGLDSCDMTLSVGFALAPRMVSGNDAHQWFAAAHAAQGLANRHGGNGVEGLLTREFEPMLAERVLIIREWVLESKSGSNVMIEFQPLVPLNAAATDLYSVHAKLRDQRSPLGGVYRDEYLRLARNAGAMVMIDRMSLFHAFETLDQERARGRRTQLMVSVDLATLDGLPWRWLEAELRRRQHLVDGMILELEATDALREAQGVACLVRLRKLGIRVCLAYRSVNLEQASAWCQLPADIMRVQYSALNAHPPRIARALLARWRALGRQIIVDEVEQPCALTQLADLDIDYLRGHALAAIGMRLDFEFRPQT